MKILVCINKTPDTTSKIAFKNNQTAFDDSGVQWIINPYDEWYSLVRAIELKEKDPTTTIHLVTVGSADCDPIIRKAFALGGDEAFRINIDSTDSYFIAAQIADLAKNYEFELSIIESKKFSELIAILEPFITRTRTKLIADLKFINETDLI
jgi:electron transfer flavoprotein beta subunit